jgi:topoisomerase-4 subunit A
MRSPPSGIAIWIIGLVSVGGELAALASERKTLAHVLDQPKALTRLVIGEIEADAKRFGDERRTLIEAVAPAVVARTVPDEPVTITLSRHGWIRARQGHGLDASQFTWKAGDAPLAILETRTVSPVVVLDTHGRAYTIRAADIPGGRGDGVPVTTLIDLGPGARVAQAIVAAPGQRFLVAGSGGYGFVASFGDMLSRQRGGRAFMTLEPDEEPIAPVPLASGLDQVAALSSRGRLLLFGLDEMREVPRGRGVIVMGLDDDERLIAVTLTRGDRLTLVGTNRTGRTVSVELAAADLAKHRLKRARKGPLASSRVKPTGFAARPAPAPRAG